MNKTRNFVSCLFLFINKPISVLFTLFSNEKKKKRRWKFDGERKEVIMRKKGFRPYVRILLRFFLKLGKVLLRDF